MLKKITILRRVGDLKMTKGTVAALVIIALALLIACCYFVLAPAKEEIAVFSGHPNWPPIMGTDKDGVKNVGIAPSLTKLAFKTFDVKVESKNLGSWEDVQEMARNGKIDGLVGAYKTKEREKYFLFSTPYAFDNITVFYPEGNSTYAKKEDLLGKRGIATAGDSYGQEMDDYIVQANLNLVRASDPEQAFLMLKEGKGDYVIYSSDSGRKMVKELNLSKITESEPIAKQSFHILISKKSKYAKDIDKVNLAIEDMIAKGTLPKE
jgi:ABC-type amino acid transport substrate-binding protein